MQRYNCSTSHLVGMVTDDDSGKWVRYEDAAARISDLEKEIEKLEVMTNYDDLLIRSRSDRISELEAQLAAAQERIKDLENDHA